MNGLLADVIDAHGGIERWNAFEKVEVSIVTGGGFYALKGLMGDSISRRVTVWLHEQKAWVLPVGDPDMGAAFTPERVAIERLDGTVVAERFAPTEAFAGHQMQTPWDELDRAYFNGEALWTYLTTPFLLAGDGVEVEETEPWKQDGETWRVLQARFPGSIETHNRVQHFFFGDDLMLRRHDYHVNIAGGFPAAQLITQPVSVDGMSVPTVRRAHTRGPDRQPILEMLMISMDISEVKFT